VKCGGPRGHGQLRGSGDGSWLLGFTWWDVQVQPNRNSRTALLTCLAFSGNEYSLLDASLQVCASKLLLLRMATRRGFM